MTNQKNLGEMTYSIDDIVLMTGAERHGFCPANISWLLTDSRSLCFPAELISILAEYYGEEQLPSSPESALVHMVDAVVIRLEAMEQNVGQSVWNRDIVIYQTVNDFSSSEIYDHSGMSMNQFLKIREFLAKEELLR